jgi:hypothetical protein
MRHDRGLAASPQVRYTLRVEGSGCSPLLLLTDRRSRAISPKGTSNRSGSTNANPGDDPGQEAAQMYLKLVFFFMRRQFGKVMTSIRVSGARMPTAFTNYYYKMSKLDKKLELPEQTAVLS